MNYQFLQVTDDMVEDRAPTLADKLTGFGKKTTAGEALLMMLQIDRGALRRVDDEGDSKDMEEEFSRAATFSDAEIGPFLSRVTKFPASKVGHLVEALRDPGVRVLEAVSGGWRIRGLSARYKRFATGRISSRQRTANNARARDAGWEAGPGTTWVHRGRNSKMDTLNDVIALLEKEETP